MKNESQEDGVFARVQWANGVLATRELANITIDQFEEELILTTAWIWRDLQAGIVVGAAQIILESDRLHKPLQLGIFFSLRRRR